MSNTVKLAAKLPGDEVINGLDGQVEHFLTDTEETPIICLAWVTVREVRRIPTTGDEIPTVEIRRIEPIGTPLETPYEIKELAAQINERRLGRTPLPFDEVVVPAGMVSALGNEDDDYDEEDDVDEDQPERDVATVTDVFGMPDDVDEDQA